MKLENYEVHLPNYSIGDKIYDKIGPVCESYGKKVLVIGGRKALEAAYDKIASYVGQTDLEIIGKEIYGENCTYAVRCPCTGRLTWCSVWAEARRWTR